MKKINPIILIIVASLSYGCTPVIVGGAAVGGYYVGKDERKAGTVFTDAGITAGINTELIKAKGISSTNIDVDTYKGVVYLYGHVPSREIERRVIRIAEAHDGVKRVISKLVISSQ